MVVVVVLFGEGVEGLAVGRGTDRDGGYFGNWGGALAVSAGHRTRADFLPGTLGRYLMVRAVGEWHVGTWAPRPRWSFVGVVGHCAGACLYLVRAGTENVRH